MKEETENDTIVIEKPNEGLKMIILRLEVNSDHIFGIADVLNSL